MRNYIIVLVLSIFGCACDSNDQDRKGGQMHANGGPVVAEELAADLKLCTEEQVAQDAVDCARDLLSALEEVSPRCGGDPAPNCVKKGNSLICPTQSPEP